MTARLSVIVPAYNEEARVGDLVRQLTGALVELGTTCELIVVDDGSSDATVARVEATDATLVRHERNQGKAAAVQTGIAASTGRYVAVLDADLEYFPQDLLPMLARAESGGVIAVYGSRYKERRNFRTDALGRVRMLKGQQVGSWAANWILTAVVLLLFGKVITDTLTGLKIYPGDFLRAQRLESVGFEGDHEITSRLIRQHIPIVELPIDYEPRSKAEGKKIGARDGLRAVATFVKGRF